MALALVFGFLRDATMTPSIDPATLAALADGRSISQLALALALAILRPPPSIHRVGEGMMGDGAIVVAVAIAVVVVALFPLVVVVALLPPRRRRRPHPPPPPPPPFPSSRGAGLEEENKGRRGEMPWRTGQGGRENGGEGNFELGVLKRARKRLW